MIDTDKYEKAYEEWILMEEPMGSFQQFLFVEYQKAHAEVKRLRKELNKYKNRYIKMTELVSDEELAEWWSDEE